VRPLPISYLHDWRKKEVGLINFNIQYLQYSEMECNCVRKITEGLFRKYKISYTLAGGGSLNFEALGFSLSSL
jgi:hypothetical protein